MVLIGLLVLLAWACSSTLCSCMFLSGSARYKSLHPSIHWLPTGAAALIKYTKALNHPQHLGWVVCVCVTKVIFMSFYFYSKQSPLHDSPQFCPIVLKLRASRALPEHRRRRVTWTDTFLWWWGHIFIAPVGYRHLVAEAFSSELLRDDFRLLIGTKSN